MFIKVDRGESLMARTRRQDKVYFQGCKLYDEWREDFQEEQINHKGLF